MILADFSPHLRREDMNRDQTLKRTLTDLLPRRLDIRSVIIATARAMDGLQKSEGPLKIKASLPAVQAFWETLQQRLTERSVMRHIFDGRLATLMSASDYRKGLRYTQDAYGFP